MGPSLGPIIALGVYMLGFISIPLRAGIKTITDWISRKPMANDQITPVVEKLNTMNEEEFGLLSHKITSQYQQTCTTSNSSRKIIKQMNGQIAPTNTDLCKANIAKYLENPKNNGKKLFCKIVDITNHGTLLSDSESDQKNELSMPNKAYR
jgi:hypothetical protein